jgi:DNA helicase-2/ATP-dependent DNA helicase PcrA
MQRPAPTVQEYHPSRALAETLAEYFSFSKGLQHSLQVSEARAVSPFTSHEKGSVGMGMTDETAFSDELLVGLTPEQREAVTSPARRLLVRATAGSGKTHVLTLRIQRRVTLGELDADQVLAMTFTRKAGEELRNRLFRAGIRDVRAGTFHRAAMTIVNEYRMDHDLPALKIEASRKRLVIGLLGHLREEGHAIDDHLVPRIDNEIGWALSQGYDGAAYAKSAKKQRRDCPLPITLFAEALDRYVGLCRSRGVLDFDLLLQEAIHLLRDQPRVKAAFRHRTRALFVDETQDMNPLQFALLQQMAGDDPDLFCVGDPNQSIYGFNGANPQLLNEVIRTWPDTVLLDLTRNHRSTEAIVAVANTLLEPGARGLVPANDDGPVPLIRSYATDLEEAQNVARWLTIQHQPGTSWRSMAVLARTNAQLEVIADVLEHQSIPFERRGFEHGPSSDLSPDDEKIRDVEHHDVDAVALSTIHRSKGLEFQHVVVIGVAEGQLPNYNATSAAEIAEERRLLYVALSRAEESLLLTWSRATDDRRFGERQPSRFLAPIEEVVASLNAQRAPAPLDTARRRLAAIREQLEATESPE